MPLTVIFTGAAQRDLQEIHDYLLDHHSIAVATDVFNRLEQTAGNLAAFSSRGNHPPELLALGNRDFREIHAAPYRIVYSVGRDAVHIHLVADGRRNMQALLTARLLAPLR